MAVVVLAGGASRRWGGRDKTSVLLGDRTVLEHAVGSLVAGAGVRLRDTVVVGPPDHAARTGLTGVRWVREEPPGGGPVAALAAALTGLPDLAGLPGLAGLSRLPGPPAPPGVTGLPGLPDVVVVGAGDAPFAGEAVPSLLAAYSEQVAAVIGVDPDGRDQPLLGVYRVAALRAALASVGDPAGARMRDVAAALRPTRVGVGARAALDLDTPDDLARAERLLSP